VTIGASKPADLSIALTVSAVKDSIVVSTAQVDTALSRTSDSVTVINRADLDLRQTETVADAIRTVPGWSVMSNGGRGSLTSLFPRGGESDYTLVLVDGIPQNMFGGGFDAAHLSAATIDRIEIVSGPQSALYGGGAIGGVVQIITRHGGPLQAHATFEGGGYGTKQGAFSTSGTSGAWQFGGSFDGIRTNGDTSARTNLGGVHVSNADYERFTGAGSVQWSDKPSREIRIYVRGGRDEHGSPGPYGSDPIGAYEGIDTIGRGTNVSKELGLFGAFGESGALRHHVQLTYARLNGEFLSRFSPDDPSFDQTSRTTFRYQADFGPRALPLSAGWEFLHEQNDNTFIQGGEFQEVPIKRVVSGFFVEARPDLGSRVVLSVGGRLERIQRSALEGENAGAFNPRPTFPDDVVWSFNPKVSAAWFLRPENGGMWTKLHVDAGTGIKPPTGFELAFTNNPSLKPERNKSIDIGVQQSLLGSALVADAAFFANRYDDLIVSVGAAFNGASQFRTDNIANASSRGFELGVRFQPLRDLSIRGGWTFLDTEILAVDNVPGKVPSPFEVGDPLIRRPRQQGSLDVAWTHARMTAFLTLNGRGEMLDIEPNFGNFGGKFPAEGFVTTTFGGSVRITRQLEVFARVTNAFNKQYEEALGYPALGRSGSVGIRVAASR